MKQKKSLSILIFLFLSGVGFLFAERPPIESGGWHWDAPQTLNGKWFYDVADSYKEQDGWALEYFKTFIILFTFP